MKTKDKLNRLMAFVAGLALSASTQAALLGEYTFNDTGSGTIESRMPVAMGATNVATGVNLAPLGTNTTTQFGFGGFSNLPPPDGFDGFSFGINSGNSLLWVKRAASTNASAFNQAGDTSVAVQPLHIMVSADASHEVTVSNIVVSLGGGAPTIFALQESGTATGSNTTIESASGWTGTIALDAPVVVAAGTAKAFTIYMNTGNFESMTWFDTIEVHGSVATGSAPLIGEYTFNDLGAGDIPTRMAVAMAPSSVAAGAALSQLGTNTTTLLDFAGFNNVPATANDGFGFGGSGGDAVMFWHRAESDLPSAWAISDDTSAAVQPLNFTVTAGASQIVTIHSVEFDTGINGTPTIYAVQEADAARGTTITYNNGGIVFLDTPVIVALGASKTVTIYLNSGNFNSKHQFNNIKVYGTVETEQILPASLTSITPMTGGIVKLAVDVPSTLDRYHPEGNLDLVADTWTAVPHSDDGTNPFVATNMAYSTSDGTNRVIYIQADAAEKFFRVQGVQ